jgi:hypothetical protein
MLNVESLVKKFDEKNYFNQVDAEYIVKVTKAMGFEANEEKGRMFPTWIANLEILDCLTPTKDTNKPGEVCFIGYKLNDKKRLNDLQSFCYAAGVEFANDIWDADVYQIKGKLYGKLMKVRLVMNGQWANLYFEKINETQRNKYGKFENTVFVTDDVKAIFDNEKYNKVQPMTSAPQTQNYVGKSEWGYQKSPNEGGWGTKAWGDE